MNDPVNDFLAAYSDDVRQLALNLRTIVRDVLPDTVEQVDVSAKIIAYGYDRTYKGLICAIAPQKTYVNLMFSQGADMLDPDGLLEGTGKKARHIKFRSPDDLTRPAIRAYLTEAAAMTRAAMERKNRR